MITIENGEILVGDTLGIFEYEFDNLLKDDLWGNPLTEDCWIFTIPSDDSKIGLFNAQDENIDFLPTEFDENSKHYDIFWNSELTVLFNCHDEALDYMRNYQGSFVDIIRGFYLLYIKEDMIEETLDKYSRISEVDEQKDELLYKLLSKFVMSKPFSPETTIATMKLFILDYYRFEIAEQQFNN